jgi:ubiquinone/menaquinone biosynthesis C-methylase UbiE
MLRARGARVLGVDLSAAMLREAELPGLVQADMRILPLRDRTFDGLWCQAALLHVPRPDVDVVLAEFARVLRPGGRLHLSVSEGDGEGWETDRYGSEQPRWFVHHREPPLRTALHHAGFQVTAVTRSLQGRNWLRMLAVRDG